MAPKRHSEATLKFGQRRIPLAKLRFFRRALFTWGEKNLRQFPWRRSTASRYHQIVAEVLLQRTRAEMVDTFWPAFLCRFPSWVSLASATVEEISAVLKPIGLSSQRAPRLHALGTAIAARRGRFPTSREEIEALPGVGQYIANAVLLFCFHKAHPLVDVNLARVLERFFGPRKLADIRYDPYLQQLAHAVVSGPSPHKLNWLILDFAATVCRAPIPLCDLCALSAQCSYYPNRENQLWTQNKKLRKDSH